MHHPVHHPEHHRIRNGMPSRDLGTQGWSKPWSDDAGGACVEAKALGDGRVALRQSTDPEGPALVFSPRQMTNFLAGVKAGDADFLL